MKRIDYDQMKQNTKEFFSADDISGRHYSSTSSSSKGHIRDILDNMINIQAVVAHQL